MYACVRFAHSVPSVCSGNTNDTTGTELLNIIRIENVRITRFSVFLVVFMVDGNSPRGRVPDSVSFQSDFIRIQRYRRGQDEPRFSLPRT